MATVNESVQVNVPLKTAYNQWTQFEEFPKFIRSLHAVHQLDDTHLQWKAEVWGKNMEWKSEITRQIPDRLIEWKTLSGGPKHTGSIEFRPLDSDKTEVNLHIDYRPEDIVTRLGSNAEIAQHRLHEELEHFKSFLEQRGIETGAWRGKIDNTGNPGEWRRQDSCEDE